MFLGARVLFFRGGGWGLGRGNVNRGLPGDRSRRVSVARARHLELLDRVLEFGIRPPAACVYREVKRVGGAIHDGQAQTVGAVPDESPATDMGGEAAKRCASVAYINTNTSGKSRLPPPTQTPGETEKKTC